LNFGATYAATDRLTLGGTINYVGETGTGRNYYIYAGSSGGPMNDFRQFWATNIDLHALKHDYFASKANETWNWNGGYATNKAGNLAKPAFHNNPYFALYENYNNDSRTRFFGNANANYKMTDYLNMVARISQDRYDQLVEMRTAVGSAGTPSYYRYNGSFAETNYDLIFNLDKNLTSDLNLKALLGGNVRQQDISSISAITNGGLVIPHFYALSNSLKTPNAPSEYYARKETNSVFGGVTFTYKDMVTLDGTLRRDQSSTLPKANNTYYYPAVSTSFTFSKLLQDLNWLSYGKVRANYSLVGGDAPVYSTMNTFVPGTNFNGQPEFTYTTTNNNINLKPETNHNYEFGLEASFLHNRLGFDVTYYHSRMIDQIMPITPSTATWFNNFYVSGGTVQNSGVELMVNLVPLKTTDWTWSMNLNWTKNQSRVISLYGGQPSYVITSLQNSMQLVAEVGSAYGILRGTDYQYLNGRPLIDANGKPVLNTNKKSDIGNINPDWLGGISNTISYKNLAFSFLIDIREGGKVYSLDMDYGSTSGLYPETAGFNANGKSVRSPLADGGGIVLPGVTADGKPNQTRFDASDINTGNFPFGSVNGIMAARSYVYDASYIKLREVALTWSLPKKTIAKIGFLKGLDLSLTSRNPWIIHKNLPYNDPEQGQASGNASMGFQTGAYPSIKTFGCNVKLKF
jgi:outer membrane receptor protein involved in Fe transport